MPITVCDMALRTLLPVPLLALGLALSGCGDEPSLAPAGSSSQTSAPSTPDSTPPVQTPTPTPSESVTASALIDYGAEGVSVEQPGQVDLLEGAPEDFKAFVAEEVQAAIDEGASCPDAFHGVTVSRIQGDLALGGVNTCGGYVAIWARVDGAWTEILAGQEAWECGVLEEHGVPAKFAGGCR